MDRVIAAQVYLRICELGSLSAAARALGMSRPMVSRYLEQMESWAGARLIHRSTRRLTLTPAGEKVLLKTRGLTRIAAKVLHPPTVRARELAVNGRAEQYVAAFHTLFGVDVRASQKAAGHTADDRTEASPKQHR